MRKAFIISICALLAAGLGVVLLVTSCGGGGGGAVVPEEGEGAVPVQASGKKVLVVLPQIDFQDREFVAVRDALSQAGCKFAVATREHAAAVGVSGTSVTPDVLLDEVQMDDYNAVVFIGGPGAEGLYNNEHARSIAVEAVRANKVVGAICLAPVILARAGVLEGRRATVFCSMSRELEKGGARYTGSSVETDGRIITGNGPDASAEFALAFLQAL